MGAIPSRPTARRGLAALVVLVSACGVTDGGDTGSVTDPRINPPDATPCTDPDSELAPFTDAALEAAVRDSRGLGPDIPLTCSVLSGLTELDASARGIRSLDGIEGLIGLEQLALWGNEITDVTPLGALTTLLGLSLRSNTITTIDTLDPLTGLRSLDLGENSIEDIGALGGLVELRWLGLEGNEVVDGTSLRGLTALETLILRGNEDLADIQPLLDNAGLGSGDSVWLQGTAVACPDVSALVAKGVTVQSDCP